MIAFTHLLDHQIVLLLLASLYSWSSSKSPFTFLNTCFLLIYLFEFPLRSTNSQYTESSSLYEKHVLLSNSSFPIRHYHGENLNYLVLLNSKLETRIVRHLPQRPFINTDINVFARKTDSNTATPLTLPTCTGNIQCQSNLWLSFVEAVHRRHYNIFCIPSVSLHFKWWTRWVYQKVFNN